MNGTDDTLAVMYYPFVYTVRQTLLVRGAVLQAPPPRVLQHIHPSPAWRWGRKRRCSTTPSLLQLDMDLASSKIPAHRLLSYPFISRVQPSPQLPSK